MGAAGPYDEQALGTGSGSACLSSTNGKWLGLVIVAGVAVAGTFLLGGPREDPSAALQDDGFRLQDSVVGGDHAEAPPVHNAGLSGETVVPSTIREPARPELRQPQPRKIIGRVVDHQGSAFAQAQVLLWPAGNPLTQMTARADEHGGFRFDDAPAGDLLLQAMHQEAFPAPPRAAGSRETLVVMVRGLALGGRVEDALTGLPVGAFEARAKPGPIESLPVPLPESATLARTQTFEGEDGRFEFEAPFIPAGGPVHLEFAARGYVPHEETLASIGPAPLIVRLKPAARIKGRVLWSDDGSPAIGTEVRISNRVEEHGARTELAMDVGEDGTFDLPAPGHETVLLALVHPHAGPLEPRPLNPVPGQEIDLGTLRLPASGTVEVLIQGEGGEPRPGIRVEIALGEPVVPASLLTDERGMAVWSAVTTGPGLLVFHLPGLVRPLEHAVNVRRGQVTKLLVPPEAWLCRLRGSVSTDPETDASVQIAFEQRLGDDDWETVRTLNLESTREFDVGGLNPGVYRLVGLVIDGERRFRAATVVSLEPGTTLIDLTLVLEP